jgi:hypothetical protein
MSIPYGNFNDMVKEWNGARDVPYIDCMNEGWGVKWGVMNDL